MTPPQGHEAQCQAKLIHASVALTLFSMIWVRENAWKESINPTHFEPRYHKNPCNKEIFC